MKKHILFDHDGVLVDTEYWYYRAGERAPADIVVTLDKDLYVRDMGSSSFRVGGRHPVSLMVRRADQRDRRPAVQEDVAEHRIVTVLFGRHSRGLTN